MARAPGSLVPESGLRAPSPNWGVVSPATPGGGFLAQSGDNLTAQSGDNMTQQGG